VAGLVVKRIGLALVVLLALTCGSFCFFAWLGGLGHSPGPSLLTLYWHWLTGLFGGSTFHVFSQPTFTRNFTLQNVTMVQAFGHTVVLLVYAIVLVVVMSVALALLAASRRGSGLDVGARALAYVGWAIPGFLLALLVQLVVNAVGGPRGLGPFPIAGWPGTCPAGIGVNSGHLTPCPGAGSGLRYVLNVLRCTTLPALTLAAAFVGVHARYLRSTLLETLARPFVTTARAKGLPERRVLVRHAMRASLATFVGALLSDFGAILGGALAVDWVFQFNGLGTIFVSEFPVDFGSVNPYSIVPVLFLTALLVIAASALGDVATYWLDPRARRVE
jgi:ABC-type dipeptide/oligopeptide/nickel transport system permease component